MPAAAGGDRRGQITVQIGVVGTRNTPRQVSPPPGLGVLQVEAAVEHDVGALGAGQQITKGRGIDEGGKAHWL